MTLWSYVTQWIGYLGWCATGSDPACRPFVGFLALAGASGGTLTLLVLGLVRMLNAWEREYAATRAAAAHRRERKVRERPHPEPVLAPGVAAVAYAARAEPVVPAAGLEVAPVSAAPAVVLPLRPTA